MKLKRLFFFNIINKFNIWFEYSDNISPSFSKFRIKSVINGINSSSIRITPNILPKSVNLLAQNERIGWLSDLSDSIINEAF